jgi:hypothetical protein
MELEQGGIPASSVVLTQEIDQVSATGAIPLRVT